MVARALFGLEQVNPDHEWEIRLVLDCKCLTLRTEKDASGRVYVSTYPLDVSYKVLVRIPVASSE
jgi:hypothetical protein